MTRLGISSLLLAIYLAASGCASVGQPTAGSTTVWSCDAMAAEPAGAPVKRDLYDALAGRVRFQRGKTGTIALICPILYQLNGSESYHLRLTYLDGDGRNGPAVVRAALRRVRKSDGHVASVESSDVSSNHPNAPAGDPADWHTHLSPPFSHSLDLDNYYYYVQIGLIREDPDVPLVVMGVAIVTGMI